MIKLSKNTKDTLNLLIENNKKRLELLDIYYTLIINDDTRIINLDLSEDDYFEIQRFFINRMEELQISTNQASSVLKLNKEE